MLAVRPVLTRSAPVEPLRVVLDTNVLLSLWAFDDSRFAPLRRCVESGAWVALGDEACIAEFKRVLGYPIFGFDAERQQRIYSEYLHIVQPVVDRVALRIALPPCRDKDDQKFLELARDGRAHWLVTSDKALLVLGRRGKLRELFRIVTPEAALSMLSSSAQTAG